MPKKRPADQPALYVPQQRYVWAEYVEDDAEADAVAFRARIRSNLTFGEVETMVLDKEQPITDAWEMLAPYVVDWNLADADGTAVPAPATGGGQQFRFIPNGLFWQIFGDLKFRSMGHVDAKRLAPSKATGSTDGATN